MGVHTFGTVHGPCELGASNDSDKILLSVGCNCVVAQANLPFAHEFLRLGGPFVIWTTMGAPRIGALQRFQSLFLWFHPHRQVTTIVARSWPGAFRYVSLFRPPVTTPISTRPMMSVLGLYRGLTGYLISALLLHGAHPSASTQFLKTGSHKTQFTSLISTHCGKTHPPRLSMRIQNLAARLSCHHSAVQQPRYMSLWPSSKALWCLQGEKRAELYWVERWHPKFARLSRMAVSQLSSDVDRQRFVEDNINGGKIRNMTSNARLPGNSPRRHRSLNIRIQRVL
ncbi:hypothetical protein B0H16DRAFT_1014279 [Mycena metata]|uniref:Uncharacterized protein n=1 Tax=Mycena metata TaxID=1033252 RepID=A0AAD7N2R0_9AGAR|nr:hypothetical protein B0H16DRAFT_1014279 [Mycena metata]